MSRRGGHLNLVKFRHESDAMILFVIFKKKKEDLREHPEDSNSIVGTGDFFIDDHSLEDGDLDHLVRERVDVQRHIASQAWWSRTLPTRSVVRA